MWHLFLCHTNWHRCRYMWVIRNNLLTTKLVQIALCSCLSNSVEWKPLFTWFCLMFFVQYLLKSNTKQLWWNQRTVLKTPWIKMWRSYFSERNGAYLNCFAYFVSNELYLYLSLSFINKPQISSSNFLCELLNMTAFICV